MAKRYPKWTCFAKSGGVLSNHLLMTFMPRSYKDLKQLLLDDRALSGQEPAAVYLVKTPIVASPKPAQVLPSINNSGKSIYKIFS